MEQPIMTMKAAVYTEYGPPEVLHLAEVEKPSPKENEVLVKIHATPVGSGDLIARNFKQFTPRTFSMPGPLWYPTRLIIGLRKPNRHILGAEFSGEVESVGKDVTRFKPGDEVFGYRGMNFGANAEYLVMSEKAVLTHKPASLSHEEAASLPYGAITALGFMKKLQVQPGQKILINGASGGIGIFLVQLAKHAGAEVTGVCGTPRLELVKSMGADRVIDYTKEDFTQGGQRYDLIIDILNKSSFAKVKNVLTENGRYVLVSFKMKQVFQALRTSLGGGKRVMCILSPESRAALLEVKELVDKGAIKPVVDTCFSLGQIAQAHHYAESSQKKGSVVVQVAPNGSVRAGEKC
jgi:NADPH:quinone reductase-like Zn-dependent oxidoreductase